MGGPVAKNAKQFADWVTTQLPNWPKETVHDWMRSCLPRFGADGWDWSMGAAHDLAEVFKQEASTW